MKRGIALLEEGVEEEDDGPACLVKLIDFAHTDVVAGEGPNEGGQLGMDTALKRSD